MALCGYIIRLPWGKNLTRNLQVHRDNPNDSKAPAFIVGTAHDISHRHFQRVGDMTRSEIAQGLVPVETA